MCEQYKLETTVAGLVADGRWQRESGRVPLECEKFFTKILILILSILFKGIVLGCCLQHTGRNCVLSGKLAPKLYVYWIPTFK
jgi:hypothetical protein